MDDRGGSKHPRYLPSLFSPTRDEGGVIAGLADNPDGDVVTRRSQHRRSASISLSHPRDRPYPPKPVWHVPQSPNEPLKLSYRRESDSPEPEGGSTLSLMNSAGPESDEAEGLIYEYTPEEVMTTIRPAALQFISGAGDYADAEGEIDLDVEARLADTTPAEPATIPSHWADSPNPARRRMSLYA
ncbi:hypothetical protein DL93DRAFT_2081808 [Clavulina sp. PMI_390]|nr:hypothetical protein DL93DRAFT_2081808 [Clavulina sp. PMI_390]